MREVFDAQGAFSQVGLKNGTFGTGYVPQRKPRIADSDAQNELGAVPSVRRAGTRCLIVSRSGEINFSKSATLPGPL